ncbi:MAG: CRISPR-associated endonuclease Cas2 [Chloroflexi bacterium]|nr:MAG: CRISPR-associated endonuclease Cas2 [Chloroflexota bacterium]RLC74971.1 MAG: CRISPR-associated endonuclease Cas2 [Chloroflexota bacterium]
MGSQFIVVVYDISNDKRRTKLHNALLDHGTPVQYSVFECLLDEDGLARMKRAVGKIIRPRVDRVRYYYLCQSCLKKVEITSGVEVLSEEQVIVV